MNIDGFPARLGLAKFGMASGSEQPGMLTGLELQELLSQRAETKNLDCKASFNWDLAHSDAKCELVKDILAFLNTQDGGLIIVGVRDDTLEPVGMADADFSSFDTTKVNDFLHRYTDPQSSCEVQKLTSNGSKFVIIGIPEFKDIPVICKKAGNSSKDSSKTILKLGGIYIRTEKATSVLVPTAEEMRDLINRAVLKRGDQLLSTIRTLLKGSPPAEEREIKQYGREIQEAREYFGKVLPRDCEEHGYWEVISMPQSYSRERVPSITTLYKSLLASEVSLRGWNFPHFDRETQSNFANGRQSHTIFMHHIEAHRAYESGLFVWRGAYWENSSPDFAKEHGKALSFVNVIYTVTEFLLFFKRYYERVAPDAAIRFSIEMTDIEDRALVATDWNSLPLPGNSVARVPKLVIEKDYAVPELRANAEEIAISIVQKIFEVFNRNAPDANMIRGWQQRLLSRTF
ncbi:MAG TPA: ATP-binding protein [Verrucomicrobiae bacterium]|nr:ATP-binding protein [Verrucomicrobiae bacterium]